MSKSILAKSFISKFSFKTPRDFGSSADFFYQRRRFSYTNVKINIGKIIHFKVFLQNTTRLWLFQVLYKYFKWVFHIFHNYCLHFLRQPSFSETIAYNKSQKTGFLTWYWVLKNPTLLLEGFQFKDEADSCQR